MIVAYQTIFESKKSNELDITPKLFIGHQHQPGVLLSLSTDTFDLKVKNGKIENKLHKFLTREEAKELCMSLLAAINED